jgi:thiol-disulfide isomerase/thioredoxin
LKERANLISPFDLSPPAADRQSSWGERGGEEEAEERVAAPGFTVEDENGNYVRFSDLLGRPIVLNFWASWCPPCRSEMPDFNKVFQDMGDEVAFMMINAVGSGGETRQSAARYVAEEGFVFPVFYDTEQDAVSNYGIRAFPTSVFIDSDGYIMAAVEGAIDEETLRRGIELISGN